MNRFASLLAVVLVTFATWAGVFAFSPQLPRSTLPLRHPSRHASALSSADIDEVSENNDNEKADDIPIHEGISLDAGPLWKEDICEEGRGRSRKRVLVLCTGGTLSMKKDPSQGNALAPVQGAVTSYMAGMKELTDDPEMPEVVTHEYEPLIDSSDMGPVSRGNAEFNDK